MSLCTFISALETEAKKSFHQPEISWACSKPGPLGMTATEKTLTPRRTPPGDSSSEQVLWGTCLAPSQVGGASLYLLSTGVSLSTTWAEIIKSCHDLPSTMGCRSFITRTKLDGIWWQFRVLLILKTCHRPGSNPTDVLAPLSSGPCLWSSHQHPQCLKKLMLDK